MLTTHDSRPTIRKIVVNKKIQIVKAVAIVAVVMIHSDTEGLFGVGVRPFINFAVALFIFCSGYLTKLEQQNTKKFYVKRLIKVLVPYLLWSLVYTVASEDYSELYRNLLTAKASYQLYYIFVYAQFVILTPLICKLLESNYRWIGWLVSPISIIIIRYIFLLLGLELGFPFPETIFVVWFSYYYLGLALGNNVFKYTLSHKTSIVMYAGTLVLSEIEGFVWYLYGNYDMATTQIRITSLLTSIVACFMAYLFISNTKIALKDNLFNKILVMIGDYSFGIYLAHILVRAVLRKIPGYGMLFFPVDSMVILIATTVCVIIGRKIAGEKFSKFAGL